MNVSSTPISAVPADRPALHIRDVYVAYSGVRALENVSMVVPTGAVTTILGANGAGKTSLLRTIMGLVRKRGGSIRLFGEEIGDRRADEMVERGLAMVPEGRRLFAGMTVRENLELGAYIRRNRASIQQDFDLVYSLFPVLRERAQTRTGSLSGGQQQMVAVGRALLSHPKVLLLDEPTIGLAPSVVGMIGDMVRRVAASGVTVVLVEQNAALALGVADWVYVLENGTVALSGAASEVMQGEAVRAAYLGVGPSL
jgi:branched-chain amino acid transport system ATP-binding protein